MTNGGRLARQERPAAWGGKRATGWVSALVLAVLCLAAGRSAVAHPVSVSRAFVYVSPEQVTVKLDVFLEDLFLFHSLKANNQDFLEPDTIRRGTELHKEFVRQRFIIRDVSGQRLEGKLVSVKQFDIPAEGVPLAELMAHSLTFELQYLVPAAPEFLTISQQFTDQEGVIPSEMKLVLKQENAGTVQTAELRPGDQEIVRLSWTNPPLSPEASAEEREAWLERQKEETLGITSYSSVYSFLYIEPHEVRHEILIPLLTLEDSILLARDDDEFLDLAEQDAARRQIEAYFRTGNPIEIDGQVVEPTVERCDFYGLDFKDFAQQAERRPVSLANARVGIILTYPSREVPGHVALTWNRFNNYVWAVNVVVFAFDETVKTVLSRLGSNNLYEWENPGYEQPALPEPIAVELPPRPRLALPLASLGILLLLPAAAISLRGRGISGGVQLLIAGGVLLAAAAAWPLGQWRIPNPILPPARLNSEQADRLFSRLHQNTYGAFQFQSEDAVYDALGSSVDGELHRELYLQIRRGLQMQEQGGAVARIREVQLLEGRPESLPEGSAPRDERGFAYRCRWNVAGTVEHWGHIHERTNQYEARFAVEPRDDVWKITGLEILDEQRVKFETKLRGL